MTYNIVGKDKTYPMINLWYKDSTIYWTKPINVFKIYFEVLNNYLYFAVCKQFWGGSV